MTTQPTPPDSERDNLVQKASSALNYASSYSAISAADKQAILDAMQSVTTLRQRADRLEAALREICELEEELLITDQDTENEEHYHVFSDMPIGIAKAALEQST